MFKSSNVSTTSGNRVNNPATRKMNKDNRSYHEDSTTTDRRQSNGGICIDMLDQERTKIRSTRRKSQYDTQEQLLTPSFILKDAVRAAIIPVINLDVTKETNYYENYSLFSRALELLNRRNLRQSDEQNNVQDTEEVEQIRKFYCRYYWECKGTVSASLQLCTGCRDIGKIRGTKDLYYLDIIEVTKYRTILCKRCMERLLVELVGINRKQISKELKYLRRTQGDKTPTHLMPEI